MRIEIKTKLNGETSKFPDESKIASNAEAGGFSKVIEYTRKDLKFEADILAIKEILMLIEKAGVY